jgi:hypothetical protein
MSERDGEGEREKKTQKEREFYHVPRKGQVNMQ